MIKSTRVTPPPQQPEVERHIQRRICLLVLAFTFLPFVSACAADTPAPPKYHFQCKTIEAPEPEKGNPPTATCDEVCEKVELVCVSNGDMTNPRNCETPVFSTCRCCGLGVEE